MTIKSARNYLCTVAPTILKNISLNFHKKFPAIVEYLKLFLNSHRKCHSTDHPKYHNSTHNTSILTFATRIQGYLKYLPEQLYFIAIFS